MEDAKMYQNNNLIQKQDAIETLQKYKNIQWRSNSSIMDVGCGDGSVTVNVLKKFLPSDFKKLVGVDISEKMIQFASEHYTDEKTEFTLLDIEGVLPEEFRRSFDHVFSNYALHWITNHKQAFENIYNLLTEGGHCLLVILGSHTTFDAFRIIAKRKKWSNCICDVESIIPPYHDSQDPESDISDMMKDIGFKDIDVKCNRKLCIYEKASYFMNFLKSANFYKIPSNIFDDFLQEILQLFRDMKLCNDEDSSDNSPLKFDYNLIVVYAKK